MALIAKREHRENREDSDRVVLLRVPINGVLGVCEKARGVRCVRGV